MECEFAPHWGLLQVAHALRASASVHFHGETLKTFKDSPFIIIGARGVCDAVSVKTLESNAAPYSRLEVVRVV